MHKHECTKCCYTLWLILIEYYFSYILMSTKYKIKSFFSYFKSCKFLGVTGALRGSTRWARGRGRVRGSSKQARGRGERAGAADERAPSLRGGGWSSRSGIDEAWPLWFLPNGSLVVSTRLVASVDAVPRWGNRFSFFPSLHLFYCHISKTMRWQDN